MAIITNYATLQTAVSDYLARDDLTSFVPNFIQNAENKLYRTLNLRNEETALSVAISSGVATVPSDFKALKFAYYDTDPVSVLNWVTLGELYREYPNRADSGTPFLISREGTNFVFGPLSVDGTLKGVYYAKQDPIRTTDPSWYATNAPEALLYGALLEATPFIQNDERIPVWQAYFRDIIKTLEDENANAEHSWGSLAAKAS